MNCFTDRIKEIFIIRHGETEWNRLGLIQGAGNDIDLNDNGINQATKTGKYLLSKINDNKFDLIISSPMIRAKHTANIIADILGYDKQNIIIDDKLTENYQGLISIGKYEDELRHDPFYDEFFKLKDEFFKTDHIDQCLAIKDIPEIYIKKYKMESLEHIRQRVTEFINFLKETNYKKIIVVSHSGTINWINRIILNTYDIIQGNMSNGKNCSITYYHLNNNGIFTLIVAPNTLHLKKLIK